MHKTILVMFAALLTLAGAAQGGPSLVTPATIQKLTAELASKYGESERSRIERGLNQAARFGPTPAMPSTVLKPGRSYSSKTTPLDLASATSASRSVVVNPIWV